MNWIKYIFSNVHYRAIVVVEYDSKNPKESENTAVQLVNRKAKEVQADYVDCTSADRKSATEVNDPLVTGINAFNLK